MRAIREGKVHMRPRWHFVLFSTLIALGILIIGLALIYAIGLFIFLLHESGAWFAPSFGPRGWVALLVSIPWVVVLLFVAFIVLLEYLARRYEFVYRRPLIVSGLGLTLIVLAGGFLIEPLHHRIEHEGPGMLPPPLSGLYRPPFHLHDPSVMRGVIVAGDSHKFVMLNDDGATSTVVVAPGTRLPLGADFETGDTVIVMGERSASGTIQAFGIREIDGEND